MPDRSREDELNLEIMDALSELIKRASALGQGIAQILGLSVSDLVGLHKLEEPLTMKELGQRLHCDPSFVTMIANGLEKHGFARRETSERDRRIKSVVLTSEGAAMRERLETELCTRAPWAYVLDVDERTCLLGLLRKLLAGFDSGQAMSGCEEPGETAAGETAATGGGRSLHELTGHICCTISHILHVIERRRSRRSRRLHIRAAGASRSVTADGPTASINRGFR